jgi:MFS family permease
MSAGPGQFALIARVARATELRRSHIAFTAFAIGEQASWLAVLFYALQRGGVREVGIVAALQLAPTVILTPFSAYAGDRFPPGRALAVGYGVQFVTMAATAAAMWADAPLLAYASAAAAATAVSFVRPVMGALLPAVTHDPSDLVAANVVVGLIEQIGVFIGPLLAGAILAMSSPAMAFAVSASLCAVAAIAVTPISSLADDRADPPDAGAALRTVFAGFGVLVRHSTLLMLLALIAVTGAVKGVTDFAVVALTQDRVPGGGGTSGLLAGASGLGGFVGAFTAARLIRSQGTTRQISVSLVLITVSFAAVAVADQLPLALAAVALMGAGETLLVVTTMVGLQRRVPSAVLARVFGVVEGTTMGMTAVGALVISVLSQRVSLGAAFVILAIVLVLVMSAVIVGLRSHGDELPPVDDAIVRRLLVDPILAPLAAPTIERLARQVVPSEVPIGQQIVREGEHGDRYFLIVDGTVAVTQHGRLIRHLGAGRSFGEIALLHDRARTATVTASAPCTLLALDRSDFLEAVTGHSRASLTAHRVAETLLIADGAHDSDGTPDDERPS